VTHQGSAARSRKVTGIAARPDRGLDISLRLSEAPPRAGGQAVQQAHAGGLMTRPKKSYRLELTKEQQALVMQKTGMEAKELEVTPDELKPRAEPKPAGDQP
jgi:hypothetical protein